MFLPNKLIATLNVLVGSLSALNVKIVNRTQSSYITARHTERQQVREVRNALDNKVRGKQILYFSSMWSISINVKPWAMRLMVKADLDRADGAGLPTSSLTMFFTRYCECVRQSQIMKLDLILSFKQRNQQCERERPGFIRVMPSFFSFRVRNREIY